MTPSDMGPLPLGDRQDTQQQLSLKALRNRLPEDRFLVRDERTDDKGVDVALEAKVEVRVPTKAGGEEVPLKLYGWITSSGMTIVSSGYGAKVLEWSGVLNLEHRSAPRVNLVVAYAQVSLGRNYQAVGSLSEAKFGIDKLSPHDQDFLGYLEDVCVYQTGRIDQAEYLRREGERSSSKTGVAAAGHRMEVLRQERLHSQNRDRRADLFEQMRSAAAQIESAPDAKAAHKVSARIHLLSAEGDELAGRLTLEFVQTQARADMGIPAENVAQQARKRLTQLWDDWGKRVEACIEEATAEGHPLLIADAITAKASVYQAVLLTQRMHAAAAETAWQPPEDVIRSTMEEVDRAMNIYKLAGNVEGETRAKLLLADLFDSLGQGQAAKKLAEGAVVVARAMGYWRLESHALEYIEEATIFQRFQGELAKRKAVDEDVHTADESDEKVRAVARFTLDSLGLPAERLPVLERDADACRQIARERVDFCRHINLVQDLSHTLSPSTCYATDPSRACVCEKLGHKSNVRSTDAPAVISAFKGAYCNGCPERSPKGRPGS